MIINPSIYPSLLVSYWLMSLMLIPSSASFFYNLVIGQAAVVLAERHGVVYIIIWSECAFALSDVIVAYASVISVLL